MLDKLKDIGSQVASKASDAVEGLSTTVKDGVGSLANTAVSMTEAVNEKAVRASTSQACTILEIALQELRARPLAERPVTLTAAVNFGVASLELQVHVPAGSLETDGPAAVSPGAPGAPHAA